MTNDELIEQALSCPPLEAPAEAGEDDVRGLIGEAIQGLERAIASTRFDSASKEVFAACVDDFRKVLRAQPPAREDAQPVAPWGHAVKFGANGWGFADDEDPDAIDALMADPEYQVLPLYTHPAPDALRVAVEALEKASRAISAQYALAQAEYQHLDTVASKHDKIVQEGRRAIREALAALQAEQKGGAA